MSYIKPNATVKVQDGSCPSCTKPLDYTTEFATGRAVEFCTGTCGYRAFIPRRPAPKDPRKSRVDRPARDDEDDDAMPAVRPEPLPTRPMGFSEDVLAKMRAARLARERGDLVEAPARVDASIEEDAWTSDSRPLALTASGRRPRGALLRAVFAALPESHDTALSVAAIAAIVSSHTANVATTLTELLSRDLGLQRVDVSPIDSTRPRWRWWKGEPGPERLPAAPMKRPPKPKAERSPTGLRARGTVAPMILEALPTRESAACPAADLAARIGAGLSAPQITMTLKRLHKRGQVAVREEPWGTRTRHYWWKVAA